MPNATLQVRREAGAQRALYAVTCKRLLGNGFGKDTTLATARCAPTSSCASCKDIPSLSPGQPSEIEDAFLGRRMHTREHHGAINRKNDGTAWLFDDEAPSKGEPAQVPVEWQQMLLADE
jgi:hypothetical protein